MTPIDDQTDLPSGGDVDGIADMGGGDFGGDFGGGDLDGGDLGGGDMGGGMGDLGGDVGDLGGDLAGDAAGALAGGDEAPAKISPGAGGEAVKADRRKKAVLGVPIEVVIAVGKARPLLSELVGLRRDSVLPLDSKIEDPVEIMIGDRVIARGELQEIDAATGKLGVRLTEVADLSQSL